MTAIFKDDIDRSLLNKAKEDGIVAWDIETTGLDWQTCRITTCQLYSHSIGVVIVQLRKGAIPPNLSSLLSDPQITKVFHHAPFDLGFMRHYWKSNIANVACTKVAAKTLHPEAAPDTFSLQALLLSELGVRIDKSERLSDWSVEKLSPQQVAYATNDVLHLLDLYDSLHSKLNATDLGQLYEQACSFLPSAVEYRLMNKEDVFSY